MITRKGLPLGLLVLGLLIATGCNSRRRSRDEVFADKMQLPRVYVSKSGARIIAPGNKGMFVDPDSKEEFWPALQCTNPDCPKRNGDQPYLFTPPAAAVAPGTVACPACWKKHQPENAAQKREFAQFVQPYELPDSKEVRLKLDEEYRRIVEAEADAKPQ